ncbi:anti-sigma regulatory factor (Ser/Thr protein kinase) [Nocardiopsis mwathae]|uniref:Anti-sigma regulatory factor (Ser/Thr protein kinase) n=1 Tax=Nocardiopsis mwathae TaxID=1472723 RepID=A0A7W9YNF7_9ACTN|nr:anti-sigma regulatory factor (Ser/Thr protein kinase) [Nocardiopsis mwathae]
MSRAVLLPHAPSSVSTARRRLCSDLHDAGFDSARVNDAALVLSELLSNALRHAAPLPEPFPPDCVEASWGVGADSGDGWLEIAVTDGGAATLPRVARPSRSALGGRGLEIVQHIAAKWGTEVDGGVTTVWAVLEVAVDALEPCARAEGAGSAAVPQGVGEPQTARA